ncbi:MAG: sulfurtransferase [Bifidobacteriaceae bacterium]|jgi:thiosulfate/3-mercaptopyruvate sulfurtransferase|nr:sulfurtransferase [Bifidobacteriaceae bacterium]
MPPASDPNLAAAPPDWAEAILAAARLTGPAELAALSDGPRAPRVLDVRWQLGRPDSQSDYLAGHIPGAVFADLDAELAAPPSPAAGRHPLPAPAAFQAAVRRWGLNPGDAIVIYDGAGNYAAARAWWLLVYAGFDNVSLLDGALPAWTAAGLPLESGAAVPPPGHATVASPGRLPALDIDQAAAFPAAGKLLDARAPERYLGLTEPIDPRPGHIPGAVNAPTGDNLDPAGRFWPPDRLRARFESLGIHPGSPVAAYCGSGVTAAHEVFALALAGIPAALYPGSWSQWSHTDRPAASG